MTDMEFINDIVERANKQPPMLAFPDFILLMPEQYTRLRDLAYKGASK